MTIWIYTSPLRMYTLRLLSALRCYYPTFPSSSSVEMIPLAGVSQGYATRRLSALGWICVVLSITLRPHARSTTSRTGW
ncbi:hypothetical protein PsYK624_169810 [Phanerochaete sordida]|uniref:Uncharacterized protein n=1 Tax=Phanerochaete sordida TaxID=48140 RepID=A0A9P3GRS3_9APHY|nr:hypothetical protein PsYK624_169810 [Phanerochaete sordida]